MGIERDIILDLPGLLKQAEEAFQPADVYIIRGNPDVDTEHAAEYDAFYDAIKKDVEARGLTAEFDPGLAYTSPPGGKYWIGHSRGVSRLDYAPENVQTLALDDYEPAEARQLQAEQYQKLFKELGHTDVASIPVDQRPQPGPEHYTFNDDMRTALDNMFLSKQALDREIILDLPALLKRASYLQGGVFTPRGNPTMRSFTANTPAEGFFGEYESVGEWANELPSTVLTRPSEGSFWKGDIGSTLKSWAGRGMKRKVQERDHATQFRNIQAAIAHREGVDARNRAWGAAVQNQPTTSVDSPWGEQASGPVGQPNFNAGYNPQGGPGASWDQGMGGVFYDVMRRNPHEFELHSSTGNESTWLHKPSGMQYSVPDAPSSSNRFAVHAEQPNMDEWANAMRWRQGKPARNA